MKRWHVVVGAVAVIVAVAVGAIVLVVQARSHGASRADAHVDWKPPAQTFLESSMRVQPVPGWRARVGDLGLSDDSKIATNDDPGWSHPLVGVLGDRAFYRASSPAAVGKQWWLVGVDGRTGGKAFAPVRLDTGEFAPECFLNGPEAVLCLRDDVQNAAVVGTTAWVIDARSGAVTFTGPGEVHTSSGDLHVSQVGIYAVAGTRGQGIYGVGPRANTTWFVPGDGSITSHLADGAATSPPEFATQDVGPDRVVVFSVVDGKVMSADPPQGSIPRSAAVYPGGFAVEVVAEQGIPHPRLSFFDATGKRLGQADVSDSLSSSAELPIVVSNPNSIVFSPDGGELAKVTGVDAGGRPLLVRDRLLVQDRDADGNTIVRRYDLSTGVEDKACKKHMGGFIGSDGTTALFEGGNPNVGLSTEALDLDTCETPWTLTSPIGSFRDVWRVDTTLVQLSDDGTALMSLVAPG